MLLLCGYLALYLAIFGYCASKIPTRSWWLCLPLIWLVLEFLRSVIMTGFPWLSLGYSQLDGPLQAWLPIIGEIGLSALVIGLLAFFVGLDLSSKRSKTQWACASFVLLVIFSVGIININWVIPNGKTLKVGIVQGNIAQTLRWEPEQDMPIMQKHLALTDDLWDQDLIVWPEAAIPRLEPLSTEFLQRVDQIASESKTSLITGIVDYNVEADLLFNTMLALGLDSPDANNQIYSYPHSNRFAKHQLLPIGEFVPFEKILRELAPLFDLPMSSFSRGAYQQANLQAKGVQVLPAICYEIAFPRQIAANLYPDTDILVTISNDAWFGRSHGPIQHLQIAQMRAKEFGIPVIRATNTGVSAFIDHHGEIIQALPIFEAIAAKQTVQLVDGHTPYARYGDAPTYIVAILLVMIAWLRSRPTSVH